MCGQQADGIVMISEPSRSVIISIRLSSEFERENESNPNCIVRKVNEPFNI